MHEMSIAPSILTAVTTEAARYPGSRARRVGVRIGELAGIDPESRGFWVEAGCIGCELDGLVLESEERKRRHRCVCGVEFAVNDYEFACTSCGNAVTQCVSGDELELAYVEVEEYEPSAAGT